MGRLRLTSAGALALALVACASASAASGPIVDGPARFEVLSPTLIRVEYAADGNFENRPTLTVPDRGALPGVEYETTVTGGVRVITTPAMTLRYTTGSGPINGSNLSVEVTGGGGGQPAFAAPNAPRPATGTPGNLGGWYRGLDNQAGPVPLHDGILSRDGYYLLDDTTSPLLEAGGNRFTVRPNRPGAYQDGYLFAYGTNYAEALADFRNLTGAAPLPPRSAFGIWFSRYQGYSEKDYKRLLTQFHKHRVPLDVLVVDTDFKSPHDWNGWEWTQVYFPNPGRFLNWAHGKGLDVILNIHPSIATDDPNYLAASAAAGGLPDASGRCKRFVRDPNVTCGGWNWGQPEDVESYFGLHAPFEADGVDAWWLDWCCDESRVEAPGVTPDTWINSLYALRERAQGDRWPVLSRVGGTYLDSSISMPGIWAEHRSAIHFTGDTFDTWKMLEFQTDFAAFEGAGIGMPYVSHDVGSFNGDQLPAAKYVRWVQLGAFQPIFRLHSDHAPRLPWEYTGKAKKIAAEFMRLREALVPYTYTLGRDAYDTGMPLARPMYLSWPKESGAYKADAQYMFGGGLLVAPIAKAGSRRQVWFPPGRWTDIFTGRTYAGGRTRTVKAPLDRMPVFARAGAILPRQKNIRSAAGSPDPLLLDVFTGAKGAFDLYEDSGDGLAYQSGEGARTALHWRESKGSATFIIGERQGTFPGAKGKRRYVIKVNGIARPKRVAVRSGGRTRQIRKFGYDKQKRLLTIDAGRLRTSRGAAVEISLDRR